MLLLLASVWSASLDSGSLVVVYGGPVKAQIDASRRLKAAGVAPNAGVVFLVDPFQDDLDQQTARRLSRHSTVGLLLKAPATLHRREQLLNRLQTARLMFELKTGLSPVLAGTGSDNRAEISIMKIISREAGMAWVSPTVTNSQSPQALYQRVARLAGNTGPIVIAVAGEEDGARLGQNISKLILHLKQRGYGSVRADDLFGQDAQSQSQSQPQDGDGEDTLADLEKGDGEDASASDQDVFRIRMRADSSNDRRDGDRKDGDRRRERGSSGGAADGATGPASLLLLVFLLGICF